nr:S49 family peptidase [Alphaproteobacteria bacterium]
TSGKSKSMLDSFKPEKEEDVMRLKAIQNDLHELFIAWVAERRAASIDENREDNFDGSFWLGEEAVERGFADGIGEVHGVMRTVYGEKIRLKYAEQKVGLWSMLQSSAMGRGSVGHDAALVLANTTTSNPPWVAAAVNETADLATRQSMLQRYGLTP